MTDWIKMQNRGPIHRSMEFMAGMAVGFVLASSMSCKLPKDTTLGMECNEEGCTVSVEGHLEAEHTVPLIFEADAPGKVHGEE